MDGSNRNTWKTHGIIPCIFHVKAHTELSPFIHVKYMEKVWKTQGKHMEIHMDSRFPRSTNPCDANMELDMELDMEYTWNTHGLIHDFRVVSMYFPCI